MHDLPALIDLVFKQTGQKIHYIGHSMVSLEENRTVFSIIGDKILIYPPIHDVLTF